MRKFEIAKGFEDQNINIPTRATKNSAGYDFECAEDIIIPSYFELINDYNDIFNSGDMLEMITASSLRDYLEGLEEKRKSFNIKPTLVKTGIKVLMGSDEGLYLYNRSGNPLKKGLVLANGVGIIDSDYYNNSDNDGHIMFQFYNFSPEEVVINKGERIGQGVFQKFLSVDNDNADGERTSGFGSTGI